MDHRRRYCRGDRALPTRLERRGPPACPGCNGTPGGRETPPPLLTDHAKARDQVGTSLRDSAWSGRPLALLFRMTPSLGEGPLPTYPALSTSALPLTSFPSFPKPHLPGPLRPSGPTSSSVLFLILQLWHPLNLQTPRTTHPFGRHPRSSPTVSSNCPFGDTLSAGLRPVVMAVPPSVMALG